MDLKNTGYQQGGEVNISIIAAPSNALTTDKEYGLQVSLNQFSIDWATSNICLGRESKALSETPAALLFNAKTLTLYSLKDRSLSHLQIVARLPSDSDHSQNGIAQKDSIGGLFTNIIMKFQEKIR